MAYEVLEVKKKRASDKRTHSERSMAFRAGYELTRPHLFKR